MLTLHVEASTFQQLVRETLLQLGMAVERTADAPAAPAAPIDRTLPASNIADTTNIAKADAAPVAEQVRPRRGRRPASEQPPAPPAAEPVAQPPAASSPVAPAETSPAPAAPAATTAAPAADAGPFGPDTPGQASVRDVLQKVAALDGGKGLRDATAIIHEFGAEQIKFIDPARYPEVVKRAETFLAEAAKAAL